MRLRAQKAEILGFVAYAVAAMALVAAVFVISGTSDLDSRTLFFPTEEYILENGYPANSSGQTYGPYLTPSSADEEAMFPEEAPDLMLARGEGGATGYVYVKDMDGDLPSNPEEAMEYMKNRPRERRIPLYDRDGETVIGTVVIKLR